MPKIGIDLGGTKIELAVLDEASNIIYRERKMTPKDSYSDTLQVIQSLVQKVEEKFAATFSVGVSMPGAISKISGTVKNANSHWLNGKFFDKDLKKLLKRDIRFANDANCFVISEVTDGIASGFRSVFGVILGTGVGGGLVIDGKLINGAASLSGEWGHCPLPWTTQVDLAYEQVCYCGKQFCIELFLSGTGMAKEHNFRNQSNLDSEQITLRALEGDRNCLASLDLYYERLAKSLAMICNIIDPEAIILGGGMSKITRLYKAVPPLINQWILGYEYSAKIMPPLHGDSSGVRGAAWLWQ